MTLDNSIVSGVQQVALVVHDIDADIEEYANRLGIGPWWVKVYAAPELTNMRIRGVEIDYSMKIALAWTGSMMWELIQPLDGPSIYKEFLEQHGEGLHHVLVDHGEHSFDDAIEAFTRRGFPPLMEGQFGKARFVYFESEGPLKTTLEIVHRAPGFRRPEPDYWYPAVELLH